MNDLIDKLNAPIWVKIALKAAVPFAVAALVKVVDEFVAKTPITLDDALWGKVKDWLKAKGVIA